MKEIYLDNAATTPVDERVKKSMEPFWSLQYGNPSSLYRTGRIAKDALENARLEISNILNCAPAEIIFTGGGTEAINLAIFGVARFYGKKENPRGHIISSQIEHHAVLHALKQLEKDGFEVTYLPVDEFGLIDSKAVAAAIRSDTILISIMQANNEIGSIEPISEISEKIASAREERKINGNLTPIFFHTDACQGVGSLETDVKKLGVDLLAFNGSKIYGPKGVGSLFLKKGVRISPLIFGGGQENGNRSGTENVPGIIGLAEALKIASNEKIKENARLVQLRDYFIGRLCREIPKVVLNGHPKKRLPNNVNVSILDIEGEAMILYLDSKGIYASTGSACTSITLDPSHVILAIGRPYEYAHGSIRFTLGRKTKKGDIDYVMEVFPDIVSKLRRISPVKMEEGKQTVSHPEAFAGQNSRIKIGGKSYK